MAKEKNQRSGIPQDLSLKSAREWVYPRVSENRFKHIEGVVKVARLLAQECGEDVFQAELAAWLHDACKELKDKELLAIAQAQGIKLHPIEEQNGHLLHGPVAALTAESELSLTNHIILDAISQHTLGAPNMTPLAKIIFLADCLEESRPYSYTAPVWQALKKNHIDMDAAILVACNLNLRHLIDTHKVIHPKTVEARNYYLKLSNCHQ